MPEIKKTATWGYEILKEGTEEVMRINVEDWPYVPSIEDNPLVMALTIDKLVEVPSISRLVFVQRKNYCYDYAQTQMLLEIASLYNRLVKQRRALHIGTLGIPGVSEADIPRRHGVIQYIVFNLLRADPLGAYVELKRILREEKILLGRLPTDEEKESEQIFIDLLNDILGLLEKTRLITLAKPNLAGYHLGDRSVYSLFFKPSITPDFFFTRLMAQIPLDGEQLDVYKVGNADVTILRVPGDIKNFYHLTPPEFKLTEDKYALLDLARTVVAEHKPKEEEFLEPDKMRTTFFNIGKDLITELAEQRGVDLTYEEIEELTNILVRYTVGFGLVETLLEDTKVNDIMINGPIGETPIFLVHGEYEECVTNIIPSRTDAQSWASKFRMLSGRPLDEANPVLDTELVLPRARARVAIIQNPLNPYGLAYALRRHRDKPWTLPLFVQNGMLSPLAAGLLSFIIDGARTLLIAGTRSSGKTSLLGAGLVEIMSKYRVITVEDSVTGDTELVSYIKGSGYDLSTLEWLFESFSKIKKVESIGGREIINNLGFKIFAIDDKGKIKPKKATKLIRHKVNKPIYEVTTATGRIIKVTGDHSLFKLGEKTIKEEVKVSELRVGDFLATPRQLPIKNKERTYYDIIKNLVKSHIDKKIFVSGKDFSKILFKHKSKVKDSFKKLGYAKITANRWIREGFLPLKIAYDVGVIGYVDKFKLSGNSEYVPTRIKLDKDFLVFTGLWLADGCYDQRSVIMSVSSSEEKGVVNRIAKRFGFTTKLHNDKFSLMINSKSLKFLMKELIYLRGNAYTKYIPCWVLNLSRRQKASFLKGLFSGDGCVSDKEVIISLASKKLLLDIQTFLLSWEVILRINSLRKSKSKPNDRTIDGRISSIKSLKRFKEVGFLQKSKNTKLVKLIKKISTHDSTDIIPLPLSIREELARILIRKEFNQNDYINRENNIGREKLKRIINALVKKTYRGTILSYLKTLSESDIFWDKIARIRRIKRHQYVYDLSVPGEENFVCNNILAHNTLELPTEALRKLGYNIQAMKVRSALTAGGTEVPADEGIRTSLRMGDSSLIVGEIRSTEAFALYEAMRIGALANVVAGTIHGDSPYGVFDRVVNDLKVPRTSFKATDIVVICNPIKSSDGLKRWRRVMSITEVRKHWEDDPLRERGFIDLMKYNSKIDQLEPTDDLINGESDILKAIAGNIKEWAGDWDAVWDNITLRAKIKETLVNYANKLKRNDILEADFVVMANDSFHRISESVREDVGFLDSKKIFFQWEDWLKRNLRKKT